MARAFEPVIFRGVIYGAGQVRALLTIGYIFFFAGPNHDAMVLRCRVGEEFHAANRDFVDLGNIRRWKRGRLGKTRFRQNPEVAYEHP